MCHSSILGQGLSPKTHTFLGSLRSDAQVMQQMWGQSQTGDKCVLGQGRAQALPHHRREGLALAYMQDASRGQTDDARPARGCKCGRKGYGLAQVDLLDCGPICLPHMLDRVQPEVVAAGLHEQCLTADWLYSCFILAGGLNLSATLKYAR